ncbi:MAG: glutamate--tRNA ligase [Chloroflexi bacterium]|uniref:Glutamate--tRNA ligase n=1 Tax=Candidatus Chlorohelix allophototropha TaxID=3003348 RepID=A0A8T7M027_9CHLR|nr:glutamate--tRNA ligase [Chloroflexota bacterium]WJW67106.1 glutamate--tRNA ligase [Chloroflexota bacterium L227-S17]
MTTDVARPARTRYAPSPTGYPHIGNLRTAVFAFLLARKTGGQFILRIEDTDQKRKVEGSLDAIRDSLNWLGIDYDEGPDKGGPHSPYFQSERLPFYQSYARQLIEQGNAYYCYCSPERLEAVNKTRQAQKVPPGYDRHCRNISQEERQAALDAGIKPVVRFRVPLEGKTSYNDYLRGTISFDNSTINDQVILKSDGFPTYHLAYMVDDYLMGVTHVMRGQEWIPSVPLHILLYKALNFPIPILVHVPLILNPPGEKGKLSKRNSAVSVVEYRKAGYVAEALLNYLVLLGWSYDDKTEIFTLPELIEKFEINRIQTTDARFSPEKLEWINAYYINHILSEEDFARRCLPFLTEAGLLTQEEAENVESDQVRWRYIVEACRLAKDKAKTLLEVAPEVDFAFKNAESLEYPAEDLIGKNDGKEGAIRVLGGIIAKLKAISASAYSDRDLLLAALDEVAAELELKRGQVLWCPRVALSGKTRSPGCPEMFILLGVEESVKRMELAISKLKG